VKNVLHPLGRATSTCCPRSRAASTAIASMARSLCSRTGRGRLNVKGVAFYAADASRTCSSADRARRTLYHGNCAARQLAGGWGGARSGRALRTSTVGAVSPRRFATVVGAGSRNNSRGLAFSRRHAVGTKGAGRAASGRQR